MAYPGPSRLVRFRVGLGLFPVLFRSNLGLGPTAVLFRSYLDLGQVAVLFRPNLDVGLIAVLFRSNLDLGLIAVLFRSNLGLGAVSVLFRSHLGIVYSEFSRPRVVDMSPQVWSRLLSVSCFGLISVSPFRLLSVFLEFFRARVDDILVSSRFFVYVLVPSRSLSYYLFFDFALSRSRYHLGGFGSLSGSRQVSMSCRFNFGLVTVYSLYYLVYSVSSRFLLFMYRFCLVSVSVSSRSYPFESSRFRLGLDVISV